MRNEMWDFVALPLWWFLLWLLVTCMRDGFFKTMRAFPEAAWDVGEMAVQAIKGKGRK